MGKIHSLRVNLIVMVLIMVGGLGMQVNRATPENASGWLLLYLFGLGWLLTKVYKMIRDDIRGYRKPHDDDTLVDFTPARLQEVVGIGDDGELVFADEKPKRKHDKE